MTTKISTKGKIWRIATRLREGWPWKSWRKKLLRLFDLIQLIKSETVLSKEIFIPLKAQAAHRQLAQPQNRLHMTGLPSRKAIAYSLCPAAPIEMRSHYHLADPPLEAQQTGLLIHNALTHFSIIEECVTRRLLLYLVGQAKIVIMETGRKNNKSCTQLNVRYAKKSSLRRRL